MTICNHLPLDKEVIAKVYSFGFPVSFAALQATRQIPSWIPLCMQIGSLSSLPAESCPAKAVGLLGGRNPQCLSPEVPNFKGIGREIKPVFIWQARFLFQVCPINSIFDR